MLSEQLLLLKGDNRELHNEVIIAPVLLNMT